MPEDVGSYRGRGRTEDPLQGGGRAKTARGRTATGWHELCEITHTAALEALGKATRPNPLPWLQGREVEKEAPDDEEAKARAGYKALWQADDLGQQLGTVEQIDAARIVLRAASKRERTTIRGWELESGHCDSAVEKERSRKDNNTWRGVTLLSVGSKLMARVLASRLQRWSEPWVNEAQGLCECASN